MFYIGSRRMPIPTAWIPSIWACACRIVYSKQNRRTSARANKKRMWCRRLSNSLLSIVRHCSVQMWLLASRINVSLFIQFPTDVSRSGWGFSLDTYLFFRSVRPAASSIESLDEVESSPHIPVVNRSRDSGLATSDQPFNDDSSEVSEHFRRQTPLTPPNWTTSISYGKGTVLTSIIVPNSRYRSSKNIYKPSRQFMERERLTNDTTDDSDRDAAAAAGDSSVRSSSTTVNNMAIGKIKRTKPISRHSSLGSSEYQHQQQHHHNQQHPQSQSLLSAESKRTANSDVKRTSSLKQFHHSSDDDDDRTEDLTRTFNSISTTNTTAGKKKSLPITPKKTEQILSSLASVQSKNPLNERRSRLVKSKTSGPNKNSDEESMTTR